MIDRYQCPGCDGYGSTGYLDEDEEGDEDQIYTDCLWCQGQGYIPINKNIPISDIYLALAILAGDHAAALVAADKVHEEYGNSPSVIARVVSKAVEEEREACAILTESYSAEWPEGLTEHIASMIRERGGKP